MIYYTETYAREEIIWENHKMQNRIKLNEKLITKQSLDTYMNFEYTIRDFRDLLHSQVSQVKNEVKVLSNNWENDISYRKNYIQNTLAMHLKSDIFDRHLTLKNQINSENKKMVLEGKILFDMKHMLDDLKTSKKNLW